MSDSINFKSLVNEKVKPKPRPSLAEDAANALREMILLEKLPPGTALPERDLAEALGISRTPLREAIRLLEIEGLVEYSGARRPRVANPDLEEICHSLRVLGSLEALAGELACVHASDEELQTIAAMDKELVSLKPDESPLVSFRRDMEFHQTIVKAARNPALAETHKIYNARLWRSRFLSSQLSSAQKVRQMEHDGITDALLARDKKAAAAALKQHLATAELNIEKALAIKTGRQSIEKTRGSYEHVH